MGFEVVNKPDRTIDAIATTTAFMLAHLIVGAAANGPRWLRSATGGTSGGLFIEDPWRTNRTLSRPSLKR
jgi:hypothetical protein